MKGIAINRHKLHEVEMLLVPYGNNTVAHLRYPKTRILHECNEDFVTLKIPSMLALELYRKGILSQNVKAEIILSISGRKIGSYFIEDFRYPNNHTNIITIVFKRN